MGALKNIAKSVVTKTPMITAKEAPQNAEIMKGGLKSVVGAAASTARANAVQPPKMHKGGPVEADGVYELKAGEHVLTQPEAEKARKHAMLAVGMKSLAMSPKSDKKK